MLVDLANFLGMEVGDMRGSIVVVVMLAMIGWDTVAYALDGFAVTYTTGTVEGARQGVGGVLENTEAAGLRFQGDGNSFLIPYARIRSYQYREETKYRMGILPMIALGLVKARSKVHSVTISWQGDRGVPEVVRLEMSRHTAEELMAILRVRAERACQPSWAKSCSAGF
jgi:hypothetical protein